VYAIHAEKNPVATALRRSLRSTNGLRSAILLGEVLGTPPGIRPMEQQPGSIDPR